MHRRNGLVRRAIALTALVVLTGTAGACLGKSGSRSGPIPNADAKEFTLTIADNSIEGGKNAAGAAWIAKWVIPQFVADQKAKGRTAVVTTPIEHKAVLEPIEHLAKRHGFEVSLLPVDERGWADPAARPALRAAPTKGASASRKDPAFFSDRSIW